MSRKGVRNSIALLTKGLVVPDLPQDVVDQDNLKAAPGTGRASVSLPSVPRVGLSARGAQAGLSITQVAYVEGHTRVVTQRLSAGTTTTRLSPVQGSIRLSKRCN
jgi:hypothetical protein